jgi:predicted LPLAT superfamily acyltransferase
MFQQPCLRRLARPCIGAGSRRPRAVLLPVRHAARRRGASAITTYHRREHAQQIAALLKDIHPDYHIFVKGIMPQDGRPVMLHAWMDDAG